MENRHGLLIDACLTLADGHAERVAALHMIEPRADPRPSRSSPSGPTVEIPPQVTRSLSAHGYVIVET